MGVVHLSCQQNDSALEGSYMLMCVLVVKWSLGVFMGVFVVDYWFCWCW